MVRGVERLQTFGGITDADAIGRLAQLRMPGAGRPRILDFDLQLWPVMVALNENRSALHQRSYAVAHGIFDKRLEQHVWHQCVQSFWRDGHVHPQTWPEPDLFNRQVLFG